MKFEMVFSFGFRYRQNDCCAYATRAEQGFFYLRKVKRLLAL